MNISLNKRLNSKRSTSSFNQEQLDQYQWKINNLYHLKTIKTPLQLLHDLTCLTTDDKISFQHLISLLSGLKVCQNQHQMLQNNLAQLRQISLILLNQAKRGYQCYSKCQQYECQIRQLKEEMNSLCLRTERMKQEYIEQFQHIQQKIKMNTQISQQQQTLQVKQFRRYQKYICQLYSEIDGLTSKNIQIEKNIQKLNEKLTIAEDRYIDLEYRYKNEKVLKQEMADELQRINKIVQQQKYQNRCNVQHKVKQNSQKLFIKKQLSTPQIDLILRQGTGSKTLQRQIKEKEVSIISKQYKGDKKSGKVSQDIQKSNEQNDIIGSLSQINYNESLKISNKLYRLQSIAEHNNLRRQYSLLSTDFNLKYLKSDQSQKQPKQQKQQKFYQLDSFLLPKATPQIISKNSAKFVIYKAIQIGVKSCIDHSNVKPLPQQSQIKQQYFPKNNQVSYLMKIFNIIAIPFIKFKSMAVNKRIKKSVHKSIM